MPDPLVIFDTTLRDGEQAPGFSMRLDEKLQLARQLDQLGVDVIEAGFPIASEDDADAVRQVATSLTRPVIAALARCAPGDIERAAAALAPAKRRRIHTFIATSDLHLSRKLRMTREACLDAAVAAVRLARTHTDDVEFSPEDASRSDFGFMCEVLQIAVDNGATTLNIPDTVGFGIPEEYAKRLQDVRRAVRGDYVISTHCHNDLGMATANSLAAVKSGARQVECTINGIGERAGNTSLEEVVMALETRRDIYGVSTGITTTEIYKTSRLVSNLTGILVQPNKAIVGANAFAYSSGIHQDGVLKERTTYEIIDPKSVGINESKIVLSPRSGRAGVRRRVRHLPRGPERERPDTRCGQPRDPGRDRRPVRPAVPVPARASPGRVRRPHGVR